MSFISLLITFLKYFPEFVELLSLIAKKVEEGYTEIQIRRSIQAINAAFKNPNRQNAASELNDIFRNKT